MTHSPPESKNPHLARIAVHPIKSLEPVEEKQSQIVANGGLEYDREYAMLDDEDSYVNGKRTADVHRIRSTFDDSIETVSLHREGKSEETVRQFDFEADREALNEWLSDHFGYAVHVERDTKGGFPDDTTLSGPTVISTGTIREVASWFDGIDTHGMRLRLRANLEIDGVPPFWEDRLFSDFDHDVAFRIGDVTLRGANPCQRCIVPVRHPHTGETYDEFQRIFIEKREQTLPDWADQTRFNHYFRLMVNTKVDNTEWGEKITIGDEVEIIGEREIDEPA